MDIAVSARHAIKNYLHLYVCPIYDNYSGKLQGIHEAQVVPHLQYLYKDL